MNSEQKLYAPSHKAKEQEESWNQINWKQAQSRVRKLQARIVKAVKQEQWRKVKNLQRLLVHSQDAKKLAVKRVVGNRGKRTPGVDKETWRTGEEKREAIKRLRTKGYKPQPLRRVYIPKANGKKRKLGIPTMKDRAMQALYAQALDPVAESVADDNSYGFRKLRSSWDAREQIHGILSRRRSPQWILEGDIKACFDEIAHKWLLEKIPMDKRVLRKWLKCGVIEAGQWQETESGTPQGGIISPVLANLTLDGLERSLMAAFVAYRSPKKPRHRNPRKINVVRYADDFIITADNEEFLRGQVMPKVIEFLKERGLTLSEEKTKITEVFEGFDFLGYEVRKYNQKLLIKPSKGGIKKLKKAAKKILNETRGRTTTEAIQRLNKLLQGWGNYYRTAVSKDIFYTLDYWMVKKLLKWAKRRHPQKGMRWVKRKYFKRMGTKDFIFYEEKEELIRLGEIPIERHIKAKQGLNPYDPQWSQEVEKQILRRATRGSRRRKILERQRGKCAVCEGWLDTGEPMEIHHIKPKNQGGTDQLDNLAILHVECHRSQHSQKPKESKTAGYM